MFNFSHNLKNISYMNFISQMKILLIKNQTNTNRVCRVILVYFLKQFSSAFPPPIPLQTAVFEKCFEHPRSFSLIIRVRVYIKTRWMWSFWNIPCVVLWCAGCNFSRLPVSLLKFYFLSFSPYSLIFLFIPFLSSVMWL